MKYPVLLTKPPFENMPVLFFRGRWWLDLSAVMMYCGISMSYVKNQFLMAKRIGPEHTIRLRRGHTVEHYADFDGIRSMLARGKFRESDDVFSFYLNAKAALGPIVDNEPFELVEGYAMEDL